MSRSEKAAAAAAAKRGRSQGAPEQPKRSRLDADASFSPSVLNIPTVYVHTSLEKSGDNFLCYIQRKFLVKPGGRLEDCFDTMQSITVGAPVDEHDEDWVTVGKMMIKAIYEVGFCGRDATIEAVHIFERCIDCPFSVKELEDGITEALSPRNSSPIKDLVCRVTSPSISMIVSVFGV